MEFEKADRLLQSKLKGLLRSVKDVNDWTPFSGELFKVGTGRRAVMVAALLLAAAYLSSQSPFFDLGDVGVCRVQLVKIHLVELVVELLQKLPGQVVVAANRNG